MIWVSAWMNLMNGRLSTWVFPMRHAVCSYFVVRVVSGVSVCTTEWNEFRMWPGSLALLAGVGTLTPNEFGAWLTMPFPCASQVRYYHSSRSRARRYLQSQAPERRRWLGAEACREWNRLLVTIIENVTLISLIIFLEIRRVTVPVVIRM